MLSDFAHLTWRGRLSMAYYAARRLIVTPAPEADRCIMGYPVGEHVRCPRRAIGTSYLWCRHHDPTRGAV